MAEQNTTLVVLAGGAGSRMGKPKSRLVVDGRPILDLLLNHLDWNGPTMLVTGPDVQHPPGWERFDREVCDSIGGEGPLRGIATALEAGVGRGLVLPVDMPRVTVAPLRWFAERPVRRGLFLRRLGVIEPMPLLLTASALPVVIERLRSGRRSVHGLATEDGFAGVDAPADWPDSFWLNVNTPIDLARI